MKSPLRDLLAVTLTAASGLALAQPTVELIWRSTTGSGTPGTDTITAEAGDELILDVLVNGDEVGLLGASLSLLWPFSDVTGFDAIECASPPNASAGLCTGSTGTIFQPIFPGVAVTLGLAEEFDAATTGNIDGLPLPGFFSETMHLGRITFIVEFETDSTIEVGYSSGDNDSLQGVVDGAFETHFPVASANIQKPPGCG